jgi:segregation and condensation protein B
MSSSLRTKIESILFVAAKPMSVKRLAEVTGAEKDKVQEVLDAMAKEYNNEDHGIRVLVHEGNAQIATSPDAAKLVQDYLKDETTGELTKPSLETLTVIAYRGPIMRAELEQIRGVNCSIILRNLMMRGLVEANGEPGLPTTPYSVTMEFLRFLGISSVADLPRYDDLRSHENITRILEMAAQQKEKAKEAAVKE